MVWRATVAFQAHNPHVGKIRAGANNLFEEGRNRVINSDLLLGQHRSKCTYTVLSNVECKYGRTIQERAKQTGYRTAETACLQECQSIIGLNLKIVGVAHDVVQHVSVTVDNALGSTGRSGSVKDVCRVARQNRLIQIVDTSQVIQNFDIQNLSIPSG